MNLDTFSRRLDFLRKTGESKTSFAERLGVHQNSLSNYLNGKIPDGRTILKIHEATNVNIHWLLTGEGMPYISLDNKDALADNRLRDFPVIEAIESLLDRLSSIDEPKKQALKTLLRTYINNPNTLEISWDFIKSSQKDLDMDT